MYVKRTKRASETLKHSQCPQLHVAFIVCCLYFWCAVAVHSCISVVCFFSIVLSVCELGCGSPQYQELISPSVLHTALPQAHCSSSPKYQTLKFNLQQVQHYLCSLHFYLEVFSWFFFFWSLLLVGGQALGSFQAPRHNWDCNTCYIKKDTLHKQ